MSVENTTSNGIGVSTLLTIVFVVLKLCNVIDWNWWWVLSPLWIPVGLAIFIIVVAYFVVRVATRKIRH